MVIIVPLAVNQMMRPTFVDRLPASELPPFTRPITGAMDAMDFSLDGHKRIGSLAEFELESRTARLKGTVRR